jgi:trimethylamine:corrinoid methyltransferase-like protein
MNQAAWRNGRKPEMTDTKPYDPDLIRPVRPKYLWNILADDELEKLKEATYEILKDVGVHFPLRAYLKINHEKQLV